MVDGKMGSPLSVVFEALSLVAEKNKGKEHFENITTIQGNTHNSFTSTTKTFQKRSLAQRTVTPSFQTTSPHPPAAQHSQVA